MIRRLRKRYLFFEHHLLNQLMQRVCLVSRSVPFSPILVVKVNGFAQMVKENADWAEFELPYFLKPGEEPV